MDKTQVSYRGRAYVYGFTCTITGLIFGFSISMLNNFFVHYMQGRFPSISITKYDNIESLMNTFFNLGALLCCITSSYFMGFSRKWLNISFSVATILVNALQIPAPLEMVYVLRFILGYMSCYYTMLGPMMVQETLPNKYVGRIGSFFYLFIASGVQMSFSFTFDWVTDYYYVVLLFPAVIELIRIIVYILFFNIETPLFVYESLGKQIKSESEASDQSGSELNQDLVDPSNAVIEEGQYFERFRRDARIRLFLDRFYAPEVQDTVVRELFEEYTARSQKSKDSTGIWKIMTSKTYRKQFFLVAVINFANQMTGINVIIFYSSNMFKQLGFANPTFLTFVVSRVLVFKILIIVGNIFESEVVNLVIMFLAVMIDGHLSKQGDFEFTSANPTRTILSSRFSGL